MQNPTPPNESNKKVVQVTLHGHSWPVYPIKCRGKEIFRVFHRVNGQRVPKTFASLSKAKADAKSLLKERYGKADSKLHLTEDEKRDCQAAMNLMKQAGIRTSLETAIRHYSDLVKIVGHASLLTDVARKHAEGRGKTGTPIELAALREDYLHALKKQELSVRYQNTQRSHTGQFLKHAPDVMSDQVTRELMQEFIDSKKKCDARTKKNLLDAIEAMMRFGKSSRCVPPEWDEVDHVIAPAVQPKQVKTYTPEELKKLLAAAPKKFRPILALAAFGGIRSSEIEALDWKHIRIREKEQGDRIIRLDIDVTEESSKRSLPIDDILWNWLVGPSKREGKLWTGTHDDFYRMQQTIAKAAGVDWKQNALRHTCISAKVAITKDVPRVAYESGNSVAIIKKYYHDLLTQSPTSHCAASAMPWCRKSQPAW
jgi:integrase